MTDAAKKVKAMFAGLGKPPRAEEAVGNLHLAPMDVEAERKSSEPMVQINVRLPASVKKRVRLLAARDGVSISEVMLRAIDLYEQTHGRAPDV